MASGPAVNEPSPGAMVRRTRSELGWVKDERLGELEYREPSTALGLGAISGGGGYLYTGDYGKGATGIVAMFTALVLTAILPGGLGLLALGGVMGWGSIGAWRQASLINRFLRNRRSAEAQLAGVSEAHRLLASMPQRAAAVVPTPAPALLAPAASPQAGAHAELLTRLQKLATIRASGVIDDNEFRARKIDILSEVGAGLDAGETEALLFALLPLLDSNTLTEEDMQFVKELGT